MGPLFFFWFFEPSWTLLWINHFTLKFTMKLVLFFLLRTQQAPKNCLDLFPKTFEPFCPFKVFKTCKNFIFHIVQKPVFVASYRIEVNFGHNTQHRTNLAFIATKRKTSKSWENFTISHNLRFSFPALYHVPKIFSCDILH